MKTKKPKTLQVKIYTLANGITGEIFYVGCTENTLWERMRGHMAKFKHLNPVIELIEEVSVREATQTEQYWINQLRAWGFNLVNSRRNIAYKSFWAKYFGTDEISKIPKSHIEAANKPQPVGYKRINNYTVIQ